MSLAEVVSKGDLRSSLVATRDFLAASLDECESQRDKAALVARLTDVLERIAALPAPVKGTVLDELAAKRADGERVTARAARARRG